MLLRDLGQDQVIHGLLVGDKSFGLGANRLRVFLGSLDGFRVLLGRDLDVLEHGVDVTLEGLELGQVVGQVCVQQLFGARSEVFQALTKQKETTTNFSFFFQTSKL